MRFALTLAVAVVLGTTAAASSACLKIRFESDQAYQTRCKIEASLPFKVNIRRFEKGFLAFLSDEQKGPRNTLERDGVIRGLDGTYLTSSKDASRALKKVIQKGRGCKLLSHDFVPGRKFTYRQSCPRVPPQL